MNSFETMQNNRFSLTINMRASRAHGASKVAVHLT